MNKNSPYHMCIKCSRRFGESVNPNKQYCDKCIKIQRNELGKDRRGERKYSKQLRKFYDFQKIPLILNPYLVENVHEKIIPEIVKQEVLEIVVSQLTSQRYNVK